MTDHHDQLDRDRQTHLGRLLLRAYRAFSSRAVDRLAGRGYEGVAPAHAALLTNVDAEGVRLSDLAERMGVSRQATGTLAAALEERGYLSRRVDPTDRRATIVNLTEQGWRLMAEVVEIKADLEAELAEALGGEETAALRAGLTGLVDHFEAD